MEQNFTLALESGLITVQIGQGALQFRAFGVSLSVKGEPWSGVSEGIQQGTLQILRKEGLVIVGTVKVNQTVAQRF